MDNLVEQVVKRAKNAKYYIKAFAIITMAILIPVTFVVLALALTRGYFLTLAFFSLLICGYGMWFFISSLKVEYEYAMLSGVFRVDKIIAKRNRKKVVKVELKIIDSIFRYSDDEMSKRTFNKVYHLGSKDYSDDNYVLTYTTEAKGKCAIVFSPDEKMLDSFKPFLKREVYKEFYLK